MGAPEQQGVDLGLTHRGQQPLGQHGDLVTRHDASFDELDEAGARRTHEVDVGVGRAAPGRPVTCHPLDLVGDGTLVRARPDRADGADDAHLSGAGGLHQGTGARLDHTQHGDRQLGGEIDRRRGGVARRRSP
ncbi:MAG: hypothetical protein R2713_20300 [Ilumatobacteraceae bacterium]